MNATYQIYRDVAGNYRFRLRNQNNKIVVVGEAYRSKVGCFNGVRAVKRNCNAKIEDKTMVTDKIPHPKFEIFTDAASKFRFNLSAPNGEIIAASEAYETKQGCMNAIDAIKSSCNAEIEDLTVDQIVEASETVVEPVVGVVDTIIEMPAPLRKGISGSTITFKGRLLNKQTSKGIGNVEVNIFEKDKSFMGDSLLGSGITESDGAFSIDWKAKQSDWWDDSVGIYVVFNGTQNYGSSKSGILNIKIPIRRKKEDG